MVTARVKRWRPDGSSAADLATFAVAWMAAYGLHAYLARTGPARLWDYVVQLPLVLGVWGLALHAFGRYEAGASRAGQWRVVLASGGVAGIALLAVLRVVFADLNYSRAVVAVSILLTTIALIRPAGTNRRPVPRPSSPWGLLLGDAAIVATAWLVAYAVKFRAPWLWPVPGDTHAVRPYLRHLPDVLLVWVAALRAFDLYRPSRCRGPMSELRALALAAAVAGIGVLALLRGVFARAEYSRAVIVLAWILTVTALLVVRLLVWPRFVSSRRGTALERNDEGPAQPVARTRAPVPRPSGGRTPRWNAAATPVVSGLVVLLLSLLWYGVYLSFPLIGEDGAALYSFLVETTRSAPFWSTRFPIKWLEGLGQPNVFVTTTFDPFSWLLATRLPPEHAFRLSYALRATACWVTTYLFVAALFRCRAVALTAAWLAVLVNFFLTHPRGIPTFAGIFVATHVAVFPGLLWLYLRVVRHARLLSSRDVAFALGLVLFLLMYPLGSLLGLPALFAFGVAMAARKRPGRAGLALLKLTVLVAIVLLAPRLGLMATWSAVASVAARNVFADELTSYPRDYVPPLLWHDVPLGIRLVVALALSAILLPRQRPRSLRVLGVTLGLVVVGTQLATWMRAAAWAPHVLERLPRPFYLEYYLPPFYVAAAAWALARPRRLLAGPTGFDSSWWLRVLALCAGLWVLLGAPAALVAAVGALGWLETPARPGSGALAAVTRAARLLPAATVLFLFAGGVATWLAWPQSVHPLFFQSFRCRHRSFWCQDPPGRTMGAADSPVVTFLRERLAKDPLFRGRADFLLTPAVRFEFPLGGDEPLTREEFELLRGWYARAYRQAHLVSAGTHFRRRPDAFRPDRPRALVEALWALSREGDPALGVLPEDVAAEIVAWAARRGRPVEFLSPWKADGEITIMVQERNRNFLATGNGMLLRALPFQNVPVASSYEQALDYLYYLLWTRYVNEGAAAVRSINFTSLEVARPDRLALVGVRYILARAVPDAAPPTLPRVFEWNGYSIYEVPDPNTGNYSPSRLRFAPSLADELRAMREPGFDPRRTAVVAEGEREWLGTGPALAPLAASRLSAVGQALVFDAASAGRRSLAVLPFKFSHCWRVRWESGSGRIVRVDAALIGVAVEGAARVRLSWQAGYGSGARCLGEDGALRGAAIAAAAEIR